MVRRIRSPRLPAFKRDNKMPATMPATGLVPKTQAMVALGDFNNATNIVSSAGANKTAIKTSKLIFIGGSSASKRCD